MLKKILIIIFSVLISVSLAACTNPPANDSKAGLTQSPSSIPVQTFPSPQKSVQPTAKPSPQQTPKPSQDSKEVIAAKRDLLIFMMAYPDYVQGVKTEKDGSVYLVMKSGDKILYDDKKQKTFDEKMSGADLEDSLEIAYPLTGYTTLPKDNYDPGRIRPYALFNDIYGGSEKAVKVNLVNADIGTQKVAFNKQNGASKALEAVFKELNALCAKDADIKSSVYPLSGTFNYRYISGTELYSMHSYGVAIDLNASKNPSFRTITRAQGQKRLDSFPRQIVQVFEDHGFIWGGKWAHFDIMHFEYRPEILFKAKYGAEVKAGQPWYAGFPDDSQTQNFEKIIDKAFD